ncbi:MAG: hypothetical protein B6D46_16080 [Polyangiaceae bacterium UTPRO1]|jgi:hypothetical protein|nr:hypothetical protein [Myxococcales bacterium]OQY64975.1 MAG: hypothetical protein B6D46_16080 [Polyangiaceae bacterium UTPRO1]
MKTWKQLALITAAVAVSVTPALAGTKLAVNLVPSAAVDPPPNPTLSVKSQIKLSDKGLVQVGLAGVTDAGGALYNSTSSYATSGNLDGTEHIVTVKLYLPAIAGPPLNVTEVDLHLPMVVVKGKGKIKVSLAAMLALIGPGYGRSIEVSGVEVWALDNVNVPACQAVVANTPAITFPPDTTCRGGTQIGISGIWIP